MSAIPDSVRTACGNRINITETTRNHLKTHPEAATMLEEATSRITLPDSSFLLTSVDFNRVIGQSACVEVDPDDTILFAVRKGRHLPSHVTKRQEKVDTRFFTVIAYKNRRNGIWTLISCFNGPSVYREPHDRHFIDKHDGREFAEALEFWTTHALVWEEEIMDEPFTSSWDEVLKRR